MVPLIHARPFLLILPAYFLCLTSAKTDSWRQQKNQKRQTFDPKSLPPTRYWTRLNTAKLRSISINFWRCNVEIFPELYRCRSCCGNVRLILSVRWDGLDVRMHLKSSRRKHWLYSPSIYSETDVYTSLPRNCMPIIHCRSLKLVSLACFTLQIYEHVMERC